MRIKMLGAALTGALMLGATLAGAATAATVPPKSFFIDPITGEPDVVIAVGATANASDVVSGSLIAAAVGNMATVEETKTVTRSASTTFDYMMDYNYLYDKNSKNIEYYNSSCTNLPGGQAKWYTDYELYSTQFWETAYGDDVKDVGVTGYETSVAIAMPREVRNPNGDVVARELNTLWFSNSPKDWDSNNRIYRVSVSSGGGSNVYQLINTMVAGSPTEPIVRALPAYAGGSYDNGNGSWDFNTYDAFFTTKAWVDVRSGGAYDEDCDYIFGGTGTEMEAHEEIQVILADIETAPDGLVDLRGDRGSASGIIYRTAEIRYPLLENGQNICGVSKCDGMVDFETAVKGRINEIKFLGKMYKPLFSGATYSTSEDLYLGAYFVYGKPFAEKEKIMKVGDSYNFHGWTINLSDVNIYENKAFLTVSGPELASPFSFIMVMDAYNTCISCCPECATYGGGGSFTSNPTMRYEYDPYMVKVAKSKEVDGRSYDLFKYTAFMLDGIKTFVGADGTYLAEFNIYAVEDFGWFDDKGCCDPFVTTPNDYGLAITGGWRKVSYDANGSTAGQGKLGWYSWEDGLAAPAPTERVYIPEAYILWQPAPACDKPCPDANFDTLELQLCDNIDIPDCETAFTVNGPENYFSVTIEDIDFGKMNTTLNGETPARAYDQLLGYYGIDDDFNPVVIDTYFGRANSDSTDTDGAKIKISQTTVDTAQSITYTKSVSIDPIELIKLDIEINTTSMHKNLILVGGPVYNSIVRDLGNMGASTVDWATSPGEWEWIADPFGRGYDVLIVAGANREETRLAAQQLVSQLR
jgi:hypothetical protein